MDPVRLEVWSDYLCPWCYVTAYRLERVREEVGPHLELTWRSYLLRPRPGGRELLDFVRYTQSWMRPAGEPDAPKLRVWESTEGPPSHSVPPHVVAKAAERIDPEAFERLHRGLLRAYFEESRDITAEDNLRGLWADAGLDPGDFEQTRDPARVAETLEDHRAAVERGMTGVPTVAVAGHDGFVMGAQPLESYRRWVERLRGGVLDE